MATPIADVIHFLRTSGGSDGLRRTFLDQGEVTFEFGNDVSQREEAFAMLAFQMWDDLIDFPISLAGSDDYVNIIFSYTEDLEDDDVGGVNRDNHPFSLTHQTQVLINRDVTNTLEFGGSEFKTYLHEIGHALGLTHPGPYNGSSASPEDSVYPEDNNQFTLMSYWHNNSSNVGDASSPLLHDIAAIQAIYGAGAARTGDTTYGFNSNNARSFNGFVLDPYDFASSIFASSIGPHFAIWDTGGIDTIDSSLWPEEFLVGYPDFGYVDQFIDLRPGSFSSIGYNNLGDPDEVQTPGVNNIAIAFGVIIENAIGGGGNDTITGNDADNSLIGNGGDDKLVGFDGDDFLEGGDGNDLLMGEGDDDELRGGADEDTLLGGSGDDILEGGERGDILVGGEGFDTASYAHAAGRIILSPTNKQGDVSGDTFNSIEAFLLTPFDDTFHAFESDDDIDGSGGDDQIFGLKGNDLIQGGAGDDLLDGGDDDDELGGGLGNDTLIGGKGNDQLDGSFGADQMTGGDGDDTYRVDDVGDVVAEDFVVIGGGNPGVDLVISSIDYTLSLGVENLTLVGSGLLNGTGNLQSNHITGNASANLLDGAGGADLLIGRGGNDTYIVDNVGDIIDETGSLPGDIDTVRSSVTYSLDIFGTVFGSVEHLTLTGTAAINGTGNGLDNTLVGNAGNNTLNGRGGDDSLNGLGGADILFGGIGNDTYIIFDAADRADETTGGASDVDTVLSSVSFSLVNTAQARGNIEHVTLLNSAGNASATGNALRNTLTGNVSDNTLDGGSNADTMFGGAGDDTYIVDNAGDVVEDTASSTDIDTVLSSVTFGLNNITTTGGVVENLTLTGSAAINGVGSVGKNTLIGNSAGNTLTALADDDTLDGRGGADVMIGGTGNDTYIVDNAGDVVEDTASSVDIDTVLSSVTFGLNNITTTRGVVENLTLTGTSAINGVGTVGRNTLIGNSAGNTLTALADNDTLDGGGGADIMVGGTGNDTYIVDNAGDRVDETTGGAGDVDTVQSSISFSLINTLGNIENLTLLDSAGKANATGNALVNVLIGNTSNNELDGRGGADTMIGGTGDDTYMVDNAGDRVDETTGAVGDVDTVQSSVSFSLVNLSQTRGNVENIALTGTSAINATGSAGKNTLIGNSAGNTLAALADDDTLDGKGGADTMIGGTGNDTYVVDNAGDRVDETTGASGDVDTVQSSISFSLSNTQQTLGNVENITLTGASNIDATGNSLNNVLVGNSGRNSLSGGANHDTLEGLGGDDTLLGDSGDDTYRFSGAFGDDIIKDESGNDVIVVIGPAKLQGTERSGNDLLVTFFSDGGGPTGTITIIEHFTTGTIEALEFNGQKVVLATGLVGADLPGIITGTDAGETLDGRGGNDLLYGNGGRDTLLGGDGGDLLDGGKGKDVLVGGHGADTLIGGQGADSFVFAPGGGDDVIRDFGDGNDRIDLTAFGTTFKKLDDNRDGELDRGEGDGQLSVRHDHGDTVLTFTGGSIRIEGVTHLTANDFLL